MNYKGIDLDENHNVYRSPSGYVELTCRVRGQAKYFDPRDLPTTCPMCQRRLHMTLRQGEEVLYGKR